MLNRSSIVRAIDFREPWFVDRTAELGEELKLHRKLWEFVVIAQVYRERIQYIQGLGKALGFGVGLEPLASWFAAQEAEVLATDYPFMRKEWKGQQAAGLLDMWKPSVCNGTRFDEKVRFCKVDMRTIPADLLRGEFDFVWSCGSLEHLGGLNQGLDFICQSMQCLRHGGWAVHTTEFNPRPGATLESPDLSLYQYFHLDQLRTRLKQQDDSLLELDVLPGTEEVDRIIDSPPYGIPHLKLIVADRWITTSIVLIVRKG